MAADTAGPNEPAHGRLRFEHVPEHYPKLRLGAPWRARWVTRTGLQAPPPSRGGFVVAGARCRAGLGAVRRAGGREGCRSLGGYCQLPCGGHGLRDRNRFPEGRRRKVHLGAPARLRAGAQRHACEDPRTPATAEPPEASRSATAAVRPNLGNVPCPWSRPSWTPLASECRDQTI